MTPPGGSRDDDADSAPRRDPAPGPSGGSSPDDARAGEPGHDPQLRAMRAVWLAMRDEDPPDRGLADLLAAARHKAEAMQPRPSAWQRLLAALRRPAMLALATVTVLIAGALLIGRRSPHAEAPGLTAAQNPAGPTRPASIDHGAGSSSGDLGAGPAGAFRTREAADRGRAPPVPAPQPAPPPPAAPLPPNRSSFRPRPPTHLDMTSPASETASPASSETSGDDGDRAATGPAPAAAAPAPTPSESVTPPGASAAAAGTGPASGNNARSFARPPRAEPEAQPPAGAPNDGRNKSQSENQTEGRSNTARGAANRTADSAGSSAAHPVVNSAPAPGQRTAPAPTRADAAGDLSRQCEAAALRGDCAAVRRLVDRIIRTDRGYRARVAKDSPVAKCLAE